MTFKSWWENVTFNFQPEFYRASNARLKDLCKDAWETSRKQLTTAPMQARKASTQTSRSCRNCGTDYCDKIIMRACKKFGYKYWQPRKASA